MSRAVAVMALVGTTASEATALAQELEESMQDVEIRRAALALKAISGVLTVRLQGRERRARAEAGVDTSFLRHFGKCETCEVIPRFCTCTASRECVVCHVVKCEGMHD
jgi:hypothetical protein